MANIGNLYADLTTSSAAFQKDMGKAANAVRSSTANMNRNLAKLERSFGSIQRSVTYSIKNMMSLRSVVATVAGSAGLGLLIKKSLDAADTIAKTADRIGISTDALQEYRHAAELSGVEQSKLDRGLEAFTKRLGEARAGTGSLVTYLRAYDESLLTSIQSAASTEEALQLLFNAMDNMKNASDRAALSAAAFSRTAGVEMVNLLRDGVGGLNAMLQEARDLGLVIDESLIRNSEKANDSLMKVSKVLKTQLTATVIELAPSITKVADQMTNWVKANRKLIDQKVDETISNITTSLQNIIDIYSSLPDGVIGATGVGIIGRMLSGSTPIGILIGSMVLLNQNLDKLPGILKDINKEMQSMESTALKQMDIAPEFRDMFQGGGPGKLSGAGGGFGAAAIISPPKNGGGGVPSAVIDISQIIPPDAIDMLQGAYNQIGSIQDTWMTNYIGGLSEMVDLSSDSWLQIAQIHSDSAKQIMETEAQKKAMLINSAETIANRVAMAGQIMMRSSDKTHKTLFAITKAAAISETLINTYKAVQLARASAPPPMNYALAAAELAFGMAQVHNIASQSYGSMSGGGGGGGGSVGTYSASSVTGLPTIEPNQGTLTINIEGDVIGDEWYIEMLAEKISEAVENRDVILIASNSKQAEKIG